MKKKILLLIVLTILPIEIFGLTYGGCEYSFISKLKSLVTNINVSYDYNINNNKPVFSVTLVNITPDMYFYDSGTRKNYYYNNTNNGEITIYNYSGYSGSFKFYSAKKECEGISLGTKYYNFPTYNEYYSNPLCEGLNISICDKWAKVDYSYQEFKEMIDEYKASDEEELIENIDNDKNTFDAIIKFYIDYYYYILISIIAVCVIIIIYKSKKDKFKL